VVELAMLEDLDAARLGWVAHLYGRADEKYRRDEILDHVFKRSPAGPGLHAFVLDGTQPVGHGAIIPMPGRRGSEPLRTGKLEALFVEASHRGVRQGGQSLARTLLDRLYEYADDRGIELIHAFTPIPQIIRFLEFPGVGERSLVSVVNPTRRSERVVAVPQRVLLGAARALTGAARTRQTRPAAAEDVELVDAPLPPKDRWTLVAADGWDWYRSSPLVRVVEVGGRHGCRALVQVPGKAGEPVRLVGWRPERTAVRSALTLLAELGGLARESGAPTLRFQPWGSSAGDGELARACRLLGFVPRADLSTLWVRCADPVLARGEAAVSTPLFYLGL
jgi:GNAT superfamily N-acetyltransferase